jgi:hypothetical protein
VVTVVQVTCYGNGSLRDAIVHDEKLSKYQLEVARQKTSGRNPGWAKLHSTDAEVPGAINLEWDPSTRTLLTRIVTKGSSRPDMIMGRYVAYLLGRHRRRIRSVHIAPD